MTTWLSNARETFRAQLWPIPMTAVLTALLLGFGLPELDSVVNGHLPGWGRDVLFGGGR